jgi:hypothetical protein
MAILNALLLTFAALPAFASAQSDAPAAASAQGGCTREILIGARDTFWKGQAKLAPGAKIAFNNKLVTSLAETPYPSIKTSTWTALLTQAIDIGVCDIATFRVANSQILSTRLKVDSSGAIKEVDFLQAIQGDQFFRPSGFPTTTPAIFDQKQVPHPPPTIPPQWTPAMGMFDHKEQVNTATCKAMTGTPRLWTRRELIYAANSYCDGLKGKPFDSCVFAGKSCPRNENGVTTTGNCGVGTGVFNFPVKGRRWVADTDTGVVLGIFYFDTGKATTLFLHEYFKVHQGALSYIFAPMKHIPPAQAFARNFPEEK